MKTGSQVQRGSSTGERFSAEDWQIDGVVEQAEVMTSYQVLRGSRGTA